MDTVTQVESVRRPVPTAELGRTLMHEHVFVLSPESAANWSDEWDEEPQVAKAIDKLTELAGAGIRTIVDPTVDGLGRDIRRIARVNEAVPDLNIIPATGIYVLRRASLVRLPRPRRPARPARAHGRPVRARCPGGHPGHGHQGRVLQVRHRPPRPHRGSRAGAAGGGQGPPRDRRPASCYIDWIDPNLMAFSPNWHYLHISNEVLPALFDRGVTEDQVEDMMVRNPRTWFERA
jgi:predicted metal-dependent phosphotriesterase family hydrolase